MAPVAVPSASAALDDLVHQFADPYAFVRELVQNALDADSAEVEIDVRFAATKGDEGVITVHVDDWGVGMTREIIEKQLTRLFSSSKDGDRTKIGKFGIGFVSVFSLGPEAVCVDTARDGEAWRVLFGRERRYELFALDEAIEGTKIRIMLAGDRAAFTEHRKRCEAALRHWCHHVEADVRFAGAPIREPFELADCLCSVSAERAATKMVVGHLRGGVTARAYYNAGLTLHVEDSPPADDPVGTGVAFKVSSDRLEHTLTRDAVIRDAGYAAVMSEIDALARGALADLVFGRIAEGLAAPLDPDLGSAALWHLRRMRPADAARRVIAQRPSGRPISVGELRGRDDVLRAGARTPLTDALEQAGHLVYLAPDGDARIGLVDTLAASARVGDRWCMPTMVDAEPAWKKLAAALADVLAVSGVRVDPIVYGRFAYPESAIAERIAIAQRRPGTPCPLAEIDDLASGIFTRKRALVLNLDHPTVEACIRLARNEPLVAAYLCAKALVLERGDGAEHDTSMLEKVVEARWPT